MFTVHSSFKREQVKKKNENKKFKNPNNFSRGSVAS